MRKLLWVICSFVLALWLVGCGGGGSGEPTNTAPVADAGLDQIVSDGSLVALDGDGSWDAEGDALSYSWTFDSLPGGNTVVLLDATTANPSFIADMEGAYVVGLVVNDGVLDSAADTVTITAIGSGDLVPDFGTGGVVTSNPSASGDSASDVVSDGAYLYVVGTDSSPGDAQWRIEKRSLSTGALDPTFGVDGVVTNDLTSWETAYAAVIEGAYLYVVGADNTGVWRIGKRSLSTGALDPTFGTGGIATSDPSASDDYAHNVVSDGTYLYVVGRDWIPGNPQWRIEKRSLSTGALDPTFGTGGAVTSNPSADTDIPYTVVYDGAYLYVAGYDLSTGDRQWRIEKRSLSTGALDPTFGTGGVVTSNPTAYIDELNSVLTDGAYLYAVGHGNFKGRIEKRSLSTGAYDPAFGTGGAVTCGIPSTRWLMEAMDARIDGTYLYMVGRGSHNEVNEWHIEKRNLSDGELDTTFGVGGMAYSDPSPIFGYDVITAAVIEGAYLYSAGYDESQGAGDTQWRIEKRLK